MTDKIVVFNTCSSEDEAQRLAHALVEQRLAACVNVLPRIRSVYRWLGAVESAEEWLLIIKSSRARFAQLRSAIERLHSYEVPEIIAVPIVEGAEAYLAWLDASVAAGADS